MNEEFRTVKERIRRLDALLASLGLRGGPIDEDRAALRLVEQGTRQNEVVFIVIDDQNSPQLKSILHASAPGRFVL